MMLFLFYFFLCYLAYRLIFNFVLPVYRATRQVKKGFADIKDQMNQQHHPSGENSAAANGKKPDLNNVGEYIDFEEVK